MTMEDMGIILPPAPTGTKVASICWLWAGAVSWPRKCWGDFYEENHGEITATTWDVGPLYLWLHLEPQAGHNFSLKQNFKLNRGSGGKKNGLRADFHILAVLAISGGKTTDIKKLNETFQNGKWLCKMIPLGYISLGSTPLVHSPKSQQNWFGQKKHLQAESPARADILEF